MIQYRHICPLIRKNEEQSDAVTEGIKLPARLRENHKPRSLNANRGKYNWLRLQQDLDQKKKPREQAIIRRAKNNKVKR